MSKAKSAQIVGIDLLRFASALLVVGFHFFAWGWANPDSTPGRILAGRTSFPDLFDAAWFGWVGVHLFFVISGFVIAYSAEGRSSGQFAAGRVLRLAPAAWICATITLAAVLAAGVAAPQAAAVPYLKSLLFVPFGPWIDGVYWTLGVELAFYGLVFLLLWTGRFHRMGLMALAIGALSSAFIGATVLTGRVDLLGERIAHLLLLTHGVFFAQGVLWWLVLIKKQIRYAAALPFLMAAGLVQIQVDALHKLEGMDASGWTGAPMVVFLVAIAALAGLTLVNARLSSGARLVQAARICGLATYPLYLVHQLVGAVLVRTLVEAGVDPLAACLAAIAVCIAGSIAISLYLEPPIRRLPKPVASGAQARAGLRWRPAPEAL